MKYIYCIILTLITFSASSQEKYLTKSGILNFEASVASFEEVKAKNSTVSGILNGQTGEFAALALLKGFRFKMALMEEHFNENYVESDVHPKAFFVGTIENFTMNALSDKEKTFTLNGELTLHGKTKAVSAPVILKMTDNIIYLSSAFIVKPEDFNIKIPSVVSKKIAEQVKVEALFELKKN